MSIPKWVTETYDEEQLEKGRVFYRIIKNYKSRWEYFYSPSWERFCVQMENRFNIVKMEIYHKV